MNGHRAHAWRIVVSCPDCGTPILWTCSYSRKRRGEDGMLHCVAIDTYQRRHKIAHRCSVARLPRRRRLTLVDHARRIFRDDLISPQPNVLLDAPEIGLYDARSASDPMQ